MSLEIALLLGLVIATVIALVVWRRRRQIRAPIAPTVHSEPQTPTPEVPAPTPASFSGALVKSRSIWATGIKSLFASGFDANVREELEAILLSADLGVETCDWVLETLEARAKADRIQDADALHAALKAILFEVLAPADAPLEIPAASTPFVILMVGVNGVGKTTTIGKLAHRFQSEGRSVLLAAGDTFRAAAVEQLRAWGERIQVPVIAQESGADSASVLFDATQSAKAKGIEVVLADTAGRLQNKSNLMNELAKIGRVLGKLEIGAPHEVLLVLDASTGQNAISQTREFMEAIRPTGLVMTKLDGSAKGGIVFALAREFGLPIRYVGLGEQAVDLQPFDRQAFVDALFGPTQ
ncbi:MAG: signal recognition particle-docking protein FtsY [Gammaproteobacteria bacterium]|nr:signal recognition particle-docking protein FtsY [Gammaproteobacteria bacterium]